MQLLKLPLEVLGEILRHLDRLEDLVRGLAISRTWAAAVTHARPQRLYLYTRGTAIFQDSSQLRSLKLLQEKRCLQQLASFCFLEEHEVHVPITDDPWCFEVYDSAPHLSTGVLGLAGSWNLSKCVLAGCFSFLDAAALLPATVSHLELYLSDQDMIDLSISVFQRLPILQKLILFHDYSKSWRNYEVYEPSYLHIDCSCPTLEQLIIEGEFICCTSPASSLVSSLPNVHSLAMTVDVDESGVNRKIVV